MKGCEKMNVQEALSICFGKPYVVKTDLFNEAKKTVESACEKQILKKHLMKAMDTQMWECGVSTDSCSIGKSESSGVVCSSTAAKCPYGNS